MKNYMRFSTRAISVFILCLILTISAFSQQKELNLSPQEKLDLIKAAIKEKGAMWVPGESWVTRLSPEERLKLLGEKTFELEIIEFLSPPLMTGYPSAIDWRNKDGYNWVTSIKNQEDCGKLRGIWGLCHPGVPSTHRT